MKKRAMLVLSLAFLFWACGQGDKSPAVKGESDVDAAREFIRSALDGRWKDARRLVVQDAANMEDLETAERMAARQDVVTQRGYREAQIRIHNTSRVNDSVSIVTYSNTFRNQQDSVRVVRTGGSWLVDLKYSFPNTDARQ